MSSSLPVTSLAWLKSWEVALALLLLGAGALAPPASYRVTLGNCALYGGILVLGTGMLRDLWALLVTRPARGEEEVAMCAESIVGVAAVVVGLALVAAPFLSPALWGALAGATSWTLGRPAVAGLLALALVFSAWVHDLVFVKRNGRTRLVRHPDHGSFVVHLFRGQARACALGPISGE